jgi:hypothetical protein
MLVFVRRLRGAPVSLDVALSLTVAEFKALIHIQTGVAPAAAKLIYAGRVLQDTEALSAYNLQKECSVQLFETILQVAAPPPPAEDADGSTESASPSNSGSGSSDSASTSTSSASSASSSSAPPTAPASIRAPKSLASLKKQPASSGKAASSNNSTSTSASGSGSIEDSSPAARAWAASPVWSNDMILVQLIEAKDLLTTDFLSRALLVVTQMFSTTEQPLSLIVSEVLDFLFSPALLLLPHNIFTRFHLLSHFFSLFLFPFPLINCIRCVQVHVTRTCSYRSARRALVRAPPPTLAIRSLTRFSR